MCMHTRQLVNTKTQVVNTISELIKRPLHCFPQDYGIWERGDKLNHGFPELNASSIGMAKVPCYSMTSCFMQLQLLVF